MVKLLPSDCSRRKKSCDPGSGRSPPGCRGSNPGHDSLHPHRTLRKSTCRNPSRTWRPGHPQGTYGHSQTEVGAWLPKRRTHSPKSRITPRPQPDRLFVHRPSTSPEAAVVPSAPAETDPVPCQNTPRRRDHCRSPRWNGTLGKWILVRWTAAALAGKSVDETDETTGLIRQRGRWGDREMTLDGRNKAEKLHSRREKKLQNKTENGQ